MSPRSLYKDTNIRFWSAGTLVLTAVMAVGYFFGLLRLINGIGAVTALNDQYPWGIWIAIDVACGVALAAGGFVTAALVNVFGRKRYHALERPAILTAWLGYAFVAFGLLFDLGRYYNIWHPLVYWQGNSVLFEVGICVMFYLTVLTIEMAPTLLAGLIDHMADDSRVGRIAKRIEAPIRIAQVVVRRALPIFIVLGVLLSFMHQSSLGALMLIAPTKLSPLWWTPIMPALFLMSAIMVGLPVVIFESIIAAKTLGSKPEMELLTPVSRIIPWFIGAYFVVKIVDLVLRTEMSVFRLDEVDTLAWMAEVGLGLVVPFVMLLQKAVRRSSRWLFIAVCLVIFGVVMNRVNVFLVGFHPPYAAHRYVPTIGEIAVTAALISTIIFLYRAVAFWFPVLPSAERAAQEQAALRRTGPVPAWAWAFRGLAVVMILTFVGFYSAIHYEAIEASERYTADDVQRVTTSGPRRPRIESSQESLSFSMERMPTLLVLNSSFANKGTNDYEPVRFMHSAHAHHTDGDCTKCHHRVQRQDGDRVGRTIESVDMASFHPSSCIACHQYANEADAPTRPGIKGAYHQQCIGCHEKSALKTAPTDCQSCHHRFVPSHDQLIDIVGHPDPRTVTLHCLECHPESGTEVLKTSHWRWQGASPDAKGKEHAQTLGKLSTINSYCISVASNMERCTQCHIGYGKFTNSADFEDAGRIDCLVCHDKTGTYKKSAANSGMPEATVDLGHVARNVGRPTRKNCGACHFFGGGGANVKHGDLEPALVDPSDDMDVHMGRYDLLCQDCHTTSKHEIAGKASGLPTSTSRLKCEQCHGDHPHANSQSVGFHLESHLDNMTCQTCHIPSFAKESPTLLFWDWSKAGESLPVEKDQYGMPTFSKKKGAFVWGKDLVPTYRWYDGRTNHYDIGDKIDPEGTTVLAEPIGSIKDKHARIHPFKHFSALQPYDAGQDILATPNLWDGFWLDYDWNKALRVGMAALGRRYSGKLGFARTETWSAINHEVVPKVQSLRCRDCHKEEAVNCVRCHGHDQDGPEESCRQCHVNPDDDDYGVEGLGPHDPASAHKRLDFKSLGYERDPAYDGGRFHRIIMPYGERANDLEEDDDGDTNDSAGGDDE